METLSQLVAIPSESHHETAIADFIFDWLRTRGITAYRQDANTIAHIKGVDSSRALIFNGHIDTVPSGNAAEWTYGPYTPTIVDGIMYGLGVSDMKAGVAGLMELAEHYHTHQPPIDVWFSFVAREEVDGAGTQSFLKWFKNEKHDTQYDHIEALIAEPTDCSYIGIGHRGNYFIKIAVPTNDDAPHTLEAIARKFVSLEASWKKEYDYPILGTPSLGLTGIDYDASLKNDASLTLDIRTVPEFHEQLPEKLTQFLSAYPTASLEIMSASPVGWCPEDALLRRIGSEHFAQFEQHDMAGAADLCFFSEQSIPCVIFGPGQRELMHSINETFVVSKFDEFKTIVQQIVGYYGE